jgi:hypothetical protein
MTPLDWINAFLSIPGAIASVLLQFWLPAFVLALAGGMIYYVVQAVRGKL